MRSFMIILLIITLLVIGCLGYYYKFHSGFITEDNISSDSRSIEKNNSKDPVFADEYFIESNVSDEEFNESQAKLGNEEEVSDLKHIPRLNEGEFLMDKETKEAFSLIDEGKMDEAIVILEEIINKNPTAESFAWLAAAYGKKIHSTENIGEIIKYNKKMNESLDLAFQLNSESLEAVFVRGIKYLNTPEIFGGNVDEALNEFQRCVDSGIVNIELFTAMADAYEKKGKYEKEKYYRELAERGGNN